MLFASLFVPSFSQIIYKAICMFFSKNLQDFPDYSMNLHDLNDYSMNLYDLTDY